MEMSFRCWGNIVSLICTEWRCDEVDGECDWHTYLYIEAVALVEALESRKWMETMAHTNNMNVYWWDKGEATKDLPWCRKWNEGKGISIP